MDTAVTGMRAKITPKDFFLWTGAMVALYWNVVSFIFLIFNYVDYAFPNALSYPVDPYQGGMPYEMASLVALIPVYIVLALLIRRDISRDPSRKDVWVRRWAVILTLFVAGASVAVDVITLLASFFRGEELTLAFLLKVAVVLAVSALAFWYFIRDFHGYWDAHAREERALCALFAGVAFVSILAGFFIVGTPYDARQARFDNERVGDLESLEWQVVNYWQGKRKLPTTLDALNDPLGGYTVPLDPTTGASYEYSVSAPLTFALCATFARANENPARAPQAARPAPLAERGDSFAHVAGRACFSRTVDPERYPPAPKTLR